MAAISVLDGDPAVYMIGRTGGHQTPAGTVKRFGTPTNAPVRAEVRLHNQKSGALVKRMLSEAASGAYQFTGVAPGVYYVVAFDPAGLNSGVIETDIVAEPMP